jgi:hypothetical protein
MEDEGGEQKPLEMSLPCSVWGLVSLLLVVDGCVGVDKILEDSSHTGDPTAARLPLEAAEVLPLFSLYPYLLLA